MSLGSLQSLLELLASEIEDPEEGVHFFDISHPFVCANRNAVGRVILGIHGRQLACWRTAVDCIFGR